MQYLDPNPILYHFKGLLINGLLNAGYRNFDVFN